jgi:glycerol-3-phosphate dehydrogenase
MPITTGMYRILFEGKDYREAAVELVSRQLKSEFE